MDTGKGCPTRQGDRVAEFMLKTHILTLQWTESVICRYIREAMLCYSLCNLCERK